MLERFLYSLPLRGTSLLVARHTVVVGEARPVGHQYNWSAQSSLQQRLLSSSSSISSAQRRITFKRASRQRELILSSLEFSFPRIVQVAFHTLRQEIYDP
ncbi:hypothetical protein FOXYSP1_19622 [Fusarium oxysporum f. sp. phaseoli]